MNNITRITSDQKELFHHCITRTVAGEHLFGDREKAVFRSILQKVSDFCGIDVITYCVMSNHIHVLCRVPPAACTRIPDDEILRRYRVLFSTPSPYRPYRPEALEALLGSGSPEAAAARSLLLKRMHNLSMFMKILKLRMSIWFNKTHRRFGTLWAEKFKSIVVEGSGNPLLQMAQYIDLNPVRARLCETPTEYPFCGIADASQGNPNCRRGIEMIAQLTHPNLPPSSALAWYRERLEVTLSHRPNARHDTKNKKDTTSNQGLLERQTCLSRSLAMGSRQFLTSLMENFTPAFSKRNLRSGPPPGPGGTFESFYFGRRQRPQKN